MRYLLMGILLCVLLAGCGGGGDNATTPEAPGLLVYTEETSVDRVPPGYGYPWTYIVWHVYGNYTSFSSEGFEMDGLAEGRKRVYITHTPQNFSVTAVGPGGTVTQQCTVLLRD